MINQNMAWYNTYRPKVFEEVRGHDMVKVILQNSIKKNKIRHAYLFSGPKGVGKTTLARIFAYTLNQSNTDTLHLDIIEMDAASNTGIDDVRQLIESANIPPIEGKYKIYIIDEVHMLSKQAMNALLKILEEPPHYLVFLLATTNPEKIIPTVLSRLTVLRLSGHTEEDIIGNLKYIAHQEQINVEDEVLKIIAKRSSGSQRDAVNLLETITSHNLNVYNKENVSSILGIVPEQIHASLLELFKSDPKGTDYQNQLQSLVTQINYIGIDGETLLVQFFEYCLDNVFEFQNEFGTIIDVLGKIFAMRYPLSSVISAIALVVSLLPKDQRYASQKSQSNLIVDNENIKDLSEKEINIVHETELESTKDDQYSLNTVAHQNQNYLDNIEVGDEILQTNTSVLVTNTENDEVITHSIHKALTSSDAPPIIKMMSHDILIEKVVENTIYLSVSNGMFLSQLLNEKIQSWLIETAQKTSGLTRFTLDISQRDGSQTNQDHVNINLIKPEDSLPLNQSSEPIKNDLKEKESKGNAGIFYKVYGVLPDEIQSSAIPEFKGTIPNPPSSEHHTSWVQETEDFEFE